MNTSVIIPLYNKEAYITRAIDSVLAQTLPCQELIVIDDGSTDKGPELVSRYSDSRIRLVKQENQGPGAARNRGIRIAEGEYIAFLDADDEWLPDYLKRAREGFQLYASDAIACVSNAYNIYPFDGVRYRRHLAERGISNGVFRVERKTPPSCVNNALAWVQVGATVSKTSILRELGGFHEVHRMGEDQWLFFKVLLNYPVAFLLDEPLVLVHSEASELASNPNRPYYIPPISAYLADADGLALACPKELSGLLREVLALRAFAAAKSWGRAGLWREAGKLMFPYLSLKNSRLENFWPAIVHSTPLIFWLRQLRRFCLRREFIELPLKSPLATIKKE